MLYSIFYVGVLNLGIVGILPMACLLYFSYHTKREIAHIAARIERPIVLVGLMGAGKSTVGRRLAGMLERDFVDSDDAIEAAAQRTIPEIFDEFGEANAFLGQE